ncbi:ring-1,2-phenylacetyl-CoA epoxidase subunit PaaD [Trinickia symbiotica]|uniref:Phenylacetate-CoA oxygenase subunit PaaJ n=1 Tax=Trinickia symbiotica TaxID=863227 RepID=A0A2N7WS10_9BURK|nr:1,2-phenylacetyl-CoA epoxidase subunit PaaD [Trinickia symbiotica]PMS32121.1 phenylacetate-CoA oxygenase subunit PaaJ [Trinickia symbiotica]PPK41914.1 ring-1,2-phenylacetyl-CoA epoxidase subunit PaaD [Trinickia symbiotica]
MTHTASTTAAAKPARAADPALVRAWSVLESVPDPEIPVVSIRELGILRDVRKSVDGVLEVVITPTYSGCPAMAQIAEDIAHALDDADLGPYRIETVLAPAWTTDWISEAAREKLRAYGIAPPSGRCGVNDAASQPSVAVEHTIRFAPRASNSSASNGSGATPACPRCGSVHTQRLAQFGSTACKALYRCLDCREPFDYFKPY